MLLAVTRPSRYHARMGRRTLVFIRSTFVAVMLLSFIYAWLLWKYGPTGSGYAMARAVSFLEVSLGVGLFCLASLLLSFGNRKP
jgi:hypothetical protein